MPFEHLLPRGRSTRSPGPRSSGIDSVWLTEHHFCDDGYTPSPLVIGGAIAARTSRMRIGTNLMLLPLHDPIRLAEDAATLSLLTGGRFDLGVGMGYRQRRVRGVRPRASSNRPSLLEEGVEIIRRAWSGGRWSFYGQALLLPGDVPVDAGRPSSPPQLLIGAMAEPAIERARASATAS